MGGEAGRERCISRKMKHLPPYPMKLGCPFHLVAPKLTHPDRLCLMFQMSGL